MTNIYSLDTLQYIGALGTTTIGGDSILFSSNGKSLSIQTNSISSTDPTGVQFNSSITMNNQSIDNISSVKLIEIGNENPTTITSHNGSLSLSTVPIYTPSIVETRLCLPIVCNGITYLLPLYKQ